MKSTSMLLVQKIRERRAECDRQVFSGEIDANEWYESMTLLDAELKQAKQKMYEASYGGQLDMLRFVTGTIPAAFKKINSRFPWLTLDQVIDFEKTMRAAGGSVMTHSGDFVLTYREVGESPDGDKYEGDYSITWTCCHSIWKTSNCVSPRQTYYEVRFIDDGYPIKRTDVHQCQIDHSTECTRARIMSSQGHYGPWNIDVPHESPDLRNPNPIGRCDSPILFSIDDEFKVKDRQSRNSIGDSVTVAELKAAAQNRLDELESQSAKLRAEAHELGDLLKTLSVLTDP